MIRPNRALTIGDELIQLDSAGGLVSKIWPDGALWHFRRWNADGRVMARGWAPTREQAEREIARRWFVCAACKSTKSEHGACALCKGTASLEAPIPEVRPEWTYKGSREYLPATSKPKKPKPDTSALAEQEVLLVLRAVADGERSHAEISQRTGLRTLRLGAALAELWIEELVTKRTEKEQGLVKASHYTITEAGRERLRTDTKQLSRLVSDGGF